VEIDGVGVVLHRDGETVLAVGEYCPHLGAPMSDGWSTVAASYALGTVHDSNVNPVRY